MPRLRFETAAAVFDAFPTVAEDIKTAPRPEPPIAFLRSLANGTSPDDAIAFCAYMLPRREAVWWASHNVRHLVADLNDTDEIALRAAEDWVTEPDDARRLNAMQIGYDGDPNRASTWVARAAGWSGGSLNPDEPRGPAPAPHLTAMSAKLAVALAVRNRPDSAADIAACAERGIQIAES